MDIQRLQLNQTQQSVRPQATASSGDFSQALQQAAGQQTTSLDSIFERAAQETGVPLDLLKAVGKAESNFNPNARSQCGAMGVMQLMPATAKTLGVTDPYNPEQNIMAGAEHLRNMMDRFDGDPTLALAAYNAGSGNVYKYGGVPPFPETQNYVRKVMEYAGQDLTAGQASWGSQVSTQSVTETLQAQQDSDQADPKQMALMLRTMVQWRLNEELNGSEQEEAAPASSQWQQSMESMKTYG